MNLQNFLKNIEPPDDMPEEARRGPCEDCGGDGVERMLGRRFLCDECCDSGELAETEIVVEYDTTACDTHVVRIPADAAIRSITRRGISLFGRTRVVGLRRNDPFKGLWRTTDRGRLDAIRLGVPGNAAGALVRAALMPLYPVLSNPLAA